MVLPNILAIFQRSLPQSDERPTSRRTKPSSGDVMKEDLVRILHDNPELEKKIMATGEQALPTDLNVCNSLDVFHQSPLSPWTLDSEADVVDFIHSEVQLPSPTSRLRVDVAFRDQEGVFAMVELKRCAYIVPEDFAASIWKADIAEEELARRGGISTVSPVHRNVINGTKQVKAYARKSKCRFVALCDYQNLVLFVFDKDCADYEKASAFVLAEKDFRVGLLGFLIMACKDETRTRTQPNQITGEMTRCSGMTQNEAGCKNETTKVGTVGVFSRDEETGATRWWCNLHKAQKLD
ncbi:hypothetical protein BDV95DRAFT_600359 [Massariosphaeria phaeospora]|uniref:Uncharacterized protein n=1 Tax=Massariosphaeria phaeospora TaxID=100035 RepID=A0A7C8HY65_9PLEO|nr:hypothetical protein BDV95DRAFT_600359 [Massariosphaeria phaeospora]